MGKRRAGSQTGSLAVESWGRLFCHHSAVGLSELLLFSSAWSGVVRAAPAPPPEDPTRVVIES